MLAYQWQAERGVAVVFLHGLLGSMQDWAEVFAALQNFPEIRPLAIDLPYHGKSVAVVCDGFADVRAALHHTLTDIVGDQPFYLVGYSLGGRIALDYVFNQPNPNLAGVLLEGANIGLNTEAEREIRRRNDWYWAARFETESMKEVLNDWYHQPVFADLSDDKRLEFVEKRQNNDGKAVAKMLRATSLAGQERFFGELRGIQPHSNSRPITFLIGERDHKFRRMVEESRLNHRLIAQAGHNAHQANPQAFVDALLEIIRR